MPAPTPWDARNTLHAYKLWVSGDIVLDDFLGMMHEIYMEYVDQEDENAPR